MNFYVTSAQSCDVRDRIPMDKVYESLHDVLGELELSLPNAILSTGRAKREASPDCNWSCSLQCSRVCDWQGNCRNECRTVCGVKCTW